MMGIIDALEAKMDERMRPMVKKLDEVLKEMQKQTVILKNIEKKLK